MIAYMTFMTLLLIAAASGGDFADETFYAMAGQAPLAWRLGERVAASHGAARFQT